MKANRRALQAFAGGVSVAAGLYVLALQQGILINTTPSFAIGLYQTVDRPLERGAFVRFCPPKRPVFDEAQRRGYIGAGFCPDGYQQMLKRVLAAQGDRVVIAAEGVWVNGQRIAHSQRINADPGGRVMPRYTMDRELAPAELLLMSDENSASFDARYFGPLDRGAVRGVVRPLLTW